MNPSVEHSVSADNATHRTSSEALLEQLEERVARLISRYGEARATAAELRAQLKERDARIGELTERLHALARMRTEVERRIDGLLGQLDALDASRSPLRAEA
jgi:septal ring factor EnvC (AmiA/AmiB activator)